MFKNLRGLLVNSAKKTIHKIISFTTGSTVNVVGRKAEDTTGELNQKVI